MSDESALRQKVREAIRAGKLPPSRPERTWGGRGCGAACTICGEPVKREDVEFELEFAPEVDGSGPRNHHVHLACFTAWELESSCGLPWGSNDGTIAACERDPPYERGPA